MSGTTAKNAPAPTWLRQNTETSVRDLFDFARIPTSRRPPNQSTRDSSDFATLAAPGIEKERASAASAKRTAVMKNGRLHVNAEAPSSMKSAANAGPNISPRLMASNVAPR